jgi:hypothetical protein
MEYIFPVKYNMMYISPYTSIRVIRKSTFYGTEYNIPFPRNHILSDLQQTTTNQPQNVGWYFPSVIAENVLCMAFPVNYCVRGYPYRLTCIQGCTYTFRLVLLCTTSLHFIGKVHITTFTYT